MRLYAIPIVKNRWAYYCHSTIPSTSRLTRAVDWSSKKWELLDKAEPDSWKKKLYVRGSSIMNQLDYQEWFFKSVPGKEDIERPLDKVSFTILGAQARVTEKNGGCELTKLKCKLTGLDSSPKYIRWSNVRKRTQQRINRTCPLSQEIHVLFCILGPHIMLLCHCPSCPKYPLGIQLVSTL
jgi:hypothetical protein